MRSLAAWRLTFDGTAIIRRVSPSIAVFTCLAVVPWRPSRVAACATVPHSTALLAGQVRLTDTAGAAVGVDETLDAGVGRRLACGESHRAVGGLVAHVAAGVPARTGGRTCGAVGVRQAIDAGVAADVTLLIAAVGGGETLDADAGSRVANGSPATIGGHLARQLTSRACRAGSVGASRCVSASSTRAAVRAPTARAGLGVLAAGAAGTGRRPRAVARGVLVIGGRGPGAAAVPEANACEREENDHGSCCLRHLFLFS